MFNINAVSTSELQEFLGEFNHIQRTGTEVTILQFDAAISKIERFNGRNQDEYKILGRSGTDFNPPVNHYNEHYRKYCCGIVFTDGEAPPPENNPRGKFLWAHSSKSNINEALPGNKIKLN